MLFRSGRWIEAAAPIEHSPLYVKAGSIIPFAVCQQFTGEQPDAPYTIKIYPGADADFEIYEDVGDGYAYEKKAFATYRLHWNDKAKTLEISARKGSYRNMVKERKLNIELLDVLKRDTLGSAYRYQMNFNWKKNEAIYGLGSHIEDYMNLRGKLTLDRKSVV